MTYGEFRLQASKFAAGVDPEILDVFINKRYKQILDQRGWKGIEKTGAITTEAGEPLADLPADFKAPRVGRNEDLVTALAFWSRADFDRAFPKRIATGQPQIYTLTEANQAELYPIPDAIYTLPLLYLATFVPFGPDDTALPLLAWVSDACLLAGVRADLEKEKENFNKSDRLELEFQELLADMGRTDNMRKGVQGIKISSSLLVAGRRGGRPDRRRQMP